MHILLKVGVAIIATFIVGSLLACEQEAPRPTPTPVPIERVEDVYAFYQQEKGANPTRLKARIERKEIRAFQGVVNKIDGSKLQFLHKEELFGKDRYLECEFEHENQVVSFNRGQEAQVVGRLDGVNGTVKFVKCRGGPIEP